MEQVLLVSSSQKSADSFAALLAAHPMLSVCRATTSRDAWRMLQAKSYALVLILSPLSDSKGWDLAKMAAGTTSGVILVVRPQAYSDVPQKVLDEGVFVFTPTMGRALFNQAVTLMLAVHRRLCQVSPQTERLQQKMKEIRIVDKAKCILIQYERMSEQEAHKHIEKQAMDNRLTKLEVAEHILQSYLDP